MARQNRNEQIACYDEQPIEGPSEPHAQFAKRRAYRVPEDQREDDKADDDSRRDEENRIVNGPTLESGRCPGRPRGHVPSVAVFSTDDMLPSINFHRASVRPSLHMTVCNLTRFTGIVGPDCDICAAIVTYRGPSRRKLLQDRVVATGMPTVAFKRSPGHAGPALWAEQIGKFRRASLSGRRISGSNRRSRSVNVGRSQF